MPILYVKFLRSKNALSRRILLERSQECPKRRETRIFCWSMVLETKLQSNDVQDFQHKNKAIINYFLKSLQVWIFSIFICPVWIISWFWFMNHIEGKHFLQKFCYTYPGRRIMPSNKCFWASRKWCHPDQGYHLYSSAWETEIHIE